MTDVSIERGEVCDAACQAATAVLLISRAAAAATTSTNEVGAESDGDKISGSSALKVRSVAANEKLQLQCMTRGRRRNEKEKDRCLRSRQTGRARRGSRLESINTLDSQEELCPDSKDRC